MVFVGPCESCIAVRYKILLKSESSVSDTLGMLAATKRVNVIHTRCAPATCNPVPVLPVIVGLP